MQQHRSGDIDLGVVVPAYNEEANLSALYRNSQPRLIRPASATRSCLSMMAAAMAPLKSFGRSAANTLAYEACC